MTKARIALAALLTLGVLAFAATPAFAYGRPLVETKPATVIHVTEATLNAVVNANGVETKYYFEYGLKSEKTKYEHKTAEVSTPASETNITVGKVVSELLAKTEYRFRVVATNSNGTTDGAEETFTTLPLLPPTATTEPAEELTEKEAKLHGQVNPEGAETKYYFEYGTEKGKLTSKTEEAGAGSGTKEVSESKTLTGLTGTTTYYFRIVATNAGGTTDGGELSFTTSAKPTGETKAASGVVGTEATLNGVVNPKGAETKYYFEYGLASEKGKYEHKTAEASAGSGTTNVEVHQNATELTAKTEYRFRIVAKNLNGTVEGSEQTFTTTASVPPEFILGEGETFPVSLEGSVPSAKSTLNNKLAPMACEGVKSKGSVTGAKVLSLTIELTSCVLSSGEKPKCKTEGAEAGVVVLPGTGSLVYIDKAKAEVGILLTLPKSKFECGALKGTLKGGIVIPFTPVNSTTTKFHLAIKGNGKGKPEVSEYENEKGEVKKAEFTVTSGGEEEEAALEVPEEIPLTANKSLTISG
jgi:hypothetical protein